MRQVLNFDKWNWRLTWFHGAEKNHWFWLLCLIIHFSNVWMYLQVNINYQKIFSVKYFILSDVLFQLLRKLWITVAISSFLFITFILFFYFLLFSLHENRHWLARLSFKFRTFHNFTIILRSPNNKHFLQLLGCWPCETQAEEWSDLTNKIPDKCSSTLSNLYSLQVFLGYNFMNSSQLTHFSPMSHFYTP